MTRRRLARAAAIALYVVAGLYVAFVLSVAVNDGWATLPESFLLPVPAGETVAYWVSSATWIGVLVGWWALYSFLSTRYEESVEGTRAVGYRCPACKSRRMTSTTFLKHDREGREPDAFWVLCRRCGGQF